MIPLPCPFCGQDLKRFDHTGFVHPNGAQCWLTDWFIGAARIDLWNQRAQAGLYMQNAGTRPIFHDSPGEGRAAVDADTLNRIIDWYQP